MESNVSDLIGNLRNRPGDLESFLKIYDALKEGPKNMKTLSEKTSLSSNVVRNRLGELVGIEAAVIVENNYGGVNEHRAYLLQNENSARIDRFLSRIRVE